MAGMDVPKTQCKLVTDARGLACLWVEMFGIRILSFRLAAFPPSAKNGSMGYSNCLLNIAGALSDRYRVEPLEGCRAR